MMRNVARKWTPFAGWLLVVAAVWALMNRHAFNPQHDTLSAWLLFLASCVIGVSVVIMLIDTDEWTPRRLGVFGLVLFSGLLYGLTASVSLFHWTILTQHRLNWIRALIVVSAVLLAYSQVRYIAARLHDWRARRKETP
jgi:hypothetical protein